MKVRKRISKVVLTSLLVKLMFVSIAWGLTAQQIAKQVFPSIVLLVMEDANGQPISMGSGFFVRDNIVATNSHVIEDAVGGYAKIVQQKAKYDISGTVGIDRNVDLVLLAIKGAKAGSLGLGDSSQVQVGDEIYAVGNPLGLEGTFSKGMVSGVRPIGSETVFQVTAPISPGSSGGPMVNTQGQVIGITVATFQGGQNLNFAIPSYYLNSLLSKTTAIKPLSKKSKQGKSAFDVLGTKSIEGVIGRQFVWDKASVYSTYQDFSFSLYNKLREPVKEVVSMVIFYDKKGYPIDIYPLGPSTVIPPRLAKMQHGEIVPGEALRKLTSKIEIRVLSYKIVD